MGKRTRLVCRKYTQSVLFLSIQSGDIGLDQHSFQDIARLPDNALVLLRETVRQSFAKLAIPTQSLLHLLVLLGKKNGGSRTIAILHTTYRLTMRLVSTHISQWGVMFVGKWDSAFKGNSALRAHVARAAGIELAHREGQYVTLSLGPAEILLIGSRRTC